MTFPSSAIFMRDALEKFLSHTQLLRIAFFCGILIRCSTLAQEVIVQEGQNADDPATGVFVIPFALFNDTLGGVAVGVTAAGRGTPQPQALSYLSVLTSADGSWFTYLRSKDLQLPFSERLFLDTSFIFGSFSDIDVYVNGNPGFEGEDAGSNDSSEGNFIQSEGEDSSIKLEVSYVLPIGHGEENIRSTVYVRDGILVQGGRKPSGWNPLKSGTTSLLFTPFYRSQDTYSDEQGDNERITAGVELGLEYDNRDFSENPSEGSLQRLGLAQDLDILDSNAPWTTIDFEYTKYISFGATRASRQRVLALNMWVIDTPSWNETTTKSGETVYKRPPQYAGATLGGLERMKGFAQNRFNDRSALYYSAEYRHVLDWNPLKNLTLLQRLRVNVDWLQLVAFTELGRVADEFDVGKLHTDMKFSGGGGIRAFINHLVVRVDLGFSEEASFAQMTIDHPF
jgi:hypothetical protein